MNTSEVIKDVTYLLILLLAVGTTGFKYFANQDWVDAFQTATFFVTGLGSTTQMPDTKAKIWSAFYALFATTIFIGIAVNVIADIIERRYVK
jgi:uncharacterized membrane protein required for colicin V production